MCKTAMMRTTWCLVFVILEVVFAQDCDNIFIDGTSTHITSHDLYGIAEYDSYIDRCWILTAPEGDNVKVWTDDFELEFHHRCEYDYLEITCGPDGNDGFIGRYCGSESISWTNPVYSGGKSVYIHFHTDFGIEGRGFFLNFQAVFDSELTDNCSNRDPWDDDDDDAISDIEIDDEAIGNVVGIIVGAIVGVLVLIGVIVAVIVCICCGVCVASAASTRARQPGLVQTFPIQTYPNTYPQTIIPTQQTTQITTNQPVAQYLPPQPTAQAPSQNAVPYYPPQPAAQAPNQPAGPYYPPQPLAQAPNQTAGPYCPPQSAETQFQSPPAYGESVCEKSAPPPSYNDI